jgi:hypothetical protein
MNHICPVVIMKGRCPHLHEDGECDHSVFHEFEDTCVDVNDVCPACVCLPTIFISKEEMDI